MVGVDEVDVVGQPTYTEDHDHKHKHFHHLKHIFVYFKAGRQTKIRLHISLKCRVVDPVLGVFRGSDPDLFFYGRVRICRPALVYPDKILAVLTFIWNVYLADVMSK